MTDGGIISEAREEAKLLLGERGAAPVLAALDAHGGQTRFVGGCVRDRLLGGAIQDVDLATTLTPEAVTQALHAAGLKAVPTGIEHGTVTAVAEGRGIEITTLRRDVSTDGRRAVVAFTEDWKEDASRRDFTINALSLTADGRLHDYFGGRDDLAAGRVRFIGEAEARIREDALRILRFFRFHARFAEGAPDAEGLAACARCSPLLEGLSGERIRAEMLKLLEARGAVEALHAMETAGILPPLGLEGCDRARFEALREAESRLALPEEGLSRGLRGAAALMHGQGREKALRLAARWRLSNKERDRLAWLVADHPGEAVTGEAQARRLFRLAGPEAARDALLLAAAAQPRALNWLEALRDWRVPVFPVTGEDLIRAGMTPGPELGKTLALLERRWEEEGYMADKYTILQWADGFGA